MIRGRFISRKIEDILEEAEKLANSGFEEIIVIAQDTTKYGVDIYGKQMLPELLRKLCKFQKIKWVRFLYAYPETITDELIDVVKSEDKICKYFDIPIQHFSDSVLKRMNRRTNGKQIEDLLLKIRKEIPECVIRTSIIVGFPGETEEDFNKLFEFIKKAKFDKLGCFQYSKEDGTPASRIKNQVHHMTKKSRYNRLMTEQQKIAMENLEGKIGKIYEVLVEETSLDRKYLIGRSYMESPDTDGVILIKKNSNDVLLDKFIKVKIIGTSGYDLIGEII